MNVFELLVALNHFNIGNIPWVCAGRTCVRSHSNVKHTRANVRPSYYLQTGRQRTTLINQIIARAVAENAPSEDQEITCHGLCVPSNSDELFKLMRTEAKKDSEQEPSLASFLYSTILAHETMEASISFLLGNKLGNASLLDTQLVLLFNQAFEIDPSAITALRNDLCAVVDRDPACDQYSHCLLYFKGFQALQAYRIAHIFWKQGRYALATALQSRVSAVFHVDIHPAATIGTGILMDHATGIVIGETARVAQHTSRAGSGDRQHLRQVASICAVRAGVTGGGEHTPVEVA
ncbi:hypothetical protein CYMTET_42727 [Cymbomonas tetramitiformis]|uniref:Serine acetyltransferase N-terminal domain-containing protein n=1 Tax=Cymbomonas tetramitiformis TaxID=36881 RepID=A0AAE0C5J1_9CHLO|nr:hypothetical protein CYMTET_42727 [Cymbomonas tetramitiformis]